MMLRRRTERKAKLAASTLFKRVASGQDSSPNSPAIPVKQISKVAVAKSAKHIKTLTTGCKTVATSKLENAHRSQNCSSTSKKESVKGSQKPLSRGPLKDGVRVQQKICNLPKKENPRIPRLFENSSIKDVRTRQKLATSPKKEVGKMLEKSSLSPNKEVVWMPKNYVTSPKTEVQIPQKFGSSPKKEDDGKVLQKAKTLAKKDSAMLPQKLVSSLNTEDVAMPQKPTSPMSVANVKSLVTDNIDKRRYSEKRNKSTRQRVVGRIDLENKGPIKDLKVTTTQPMHEAMDAESLPGSGGIPQIRKRKMDFELNIANSVCVKLTKLDEKNLPGIDLLIPKSERQGTSVGTDIPLSLGNVLPLGNAQISCSKTKESSITYPSDCYTSIEFLAVIGLVQKSEVKKLEGSPNKLHREAGGKLRRILKPRLTPGMVYRRVAISKGLSVKGIIIDQEENRKSKCVPSVSTALQNVSHLKSAVQTSSAIAKFTLLRSQKSQAERKSPKLLASNKFPKATSFIKSESRKASLVPTSELLENVSAADVQVPKKVMAVSGKSEKEKKSEDDTVIQSPAKEKRMKADDVKSHHVETAISDVEPMARRSARQQGHRRRAWGHLLRANPDEFEERSKWEILNKDAFRDLTKTCYQENSAKCPTVEGPISSVGNIIDSTQIVDVLTASNNEERSEKPEVASSEWKDQSSKHQDISSGGFLEETASNVHHPNHSACHRPPLLAEKKWKNMAKESAAKKNTSKEKAVKSSKSSKPSILLPKKKKIMQGIEEEGSILKSKNESNIQCFDCPALSNYSLLSYRHKEADCILPHMCGVCWVNDHMYCRNMKRTTGDLPAFGGCIHYIPCPHYRPTGVSPHLNTFGIQQPDRWQFQKQLASSGKNFPKQISELGSSCAEHHWSDEDLLCQEQMLDSDSESSSVVLPEGTEILGLELQTRAKQIIQSLGVDQMPESLDIHKKSFLPVKETSQDCVSEEDNTVIVPEEYCEEVWIESLEEGEGGDVQELELDVQTGAPAAQSHSSWSPNRNKSHTDTMEDNVNCQKRELCLESYETSHSGTESCVSKDLTPGHHSLSNLHVIRVQVQKLDSDRVIVTYPESFEQNEHDSGRHFMQKEVKFPSGADEKALNEFLAQEAVRLVNESPLESQRKVVSWSNPTCGSGSAELRQNGETKCFMGKTVKPKASKVTGKKKKVPTATLR